MHEKTVQIKTEKVFRAIFLILTLLFSVMATANLEEDFQKGNIAFDASNYNKALKCWKRAAEQ